MENLLVAAREVRGESLVGALRGRRYWRGSQDELLADARKVLERYGLAAQGDEYAGNLSGGQKRLLELARAVMARPNLLLLDEPFAGVNPALGRRIERELESLRGDGVTLLMIEHELGIVGRLCDPIVVMAAGKVISEGSMEEIRTDEAVLDAYLVG
jgi:neutral amino acid transport system ATP-binding protein